MIDLVHLYYGDGKGKTTAAMGLALRASGRGKKVTIAQFLKSDDSGERIAWKNIPNVTVLDIPQVIKFVMAMNDAEKAQAAAEMRAILEQAVTTESDLMVLDELGSVVNTGLMTAEEVLAALDRCPAEREIVMTSYFSVPALFERADYVTEMKKMKHPFDKGAKARIGVEW
ncbi:MAG: cob(I)yrinic acid a,c-diamide adenosyltransferase [Oscillospiraceae bacterium]